MGRRRKTDFNFYEQIAFNTLCIFLIVTSYRRLNETALKNPRPIGKWKLEVNVKGVDIPVLVRKTEKSYR
jgi:hypothetical protein